MCLGASNVDSLILILRSSCEKLGKCEKPAKCEMLGKCETLFEFAFDGIFFSFYLFYNI